MEEYCTSRHTRVTRNFKSFFCDNVGKNIRLPYGMSYYLIMGILSFNGLEDIRLLTYAHLRDMAVLAFAASFFAAVRLGTIVKLNILAMHVMTAAKRLFGTPDFRFS